MPPAVRVRTSSGWQDIALQGAPGPGGLLDARTIRGQYENYNGPFTPTAENGLWCDAAGTIPLRLSYTPPVDAWWDVTLNMGIVEKSDAVYNYGFGSIRITPADVDGVAIASHYVMQHASVNLYDHRLVRRMFKLAAGTAYRVDGVFQVSAGNWRYHAGAATLYMDARAWPRGASMSGVPVPRVTTLPATPTDGQEVYYVADAAGGVIWHLRYNASSASAFKWEAIGGPSIVSAIPTDQTFAANTSYNDPATAGPIITFPRAGDYEYECSCDLYVASQTAQITGVLGLTRAGTGVFDAVGVGSVTDPHTIYLANGGLASSVHATGSIRGVTAGDTMKMQYQANNGTPHARWRIAKARPIRLS